MPSQRRSIRELKNLPAANKALQQAAQSSASKANLFVPTPEISSAGSSRSGDPTNQPAAADVSDPSAKQAPAAPVSTGVELAKLLSAVGGDLLPHTPEVALAFLQRAAHAAPKDSLAASEAMGGLSACLNRLGKHTEALQNAESACEALRKCGPGHGVQLCAMLAQ